MHHDRKIALHENYKANCSQIRVYIGGTSGGNTDQAIAFRNFILIPATTGRPSDDAVSISPNQGAVLTLKMENVLIAPDNGSNQTLATSVWDNPDLGASGVVRIPDDGICLVDALVEK